MKIHSPTATDDEPDLTPMIDVVFLLIIFFMIVAQVITDEKIKIKVPVAEHSKIPEDQGKRQTVTVRKNGDIFAGVSRLDSSDDLVPKLQAGRETYGREFKVYLRADIDTEYRDVQKIMEASAKANVFNVVFAVYQSDK